jgi:hypothetical protein
VVFKFTGTGILSASSLIICFVGGGTGMNTSWMKKAKQQDTVFVRELARSQF